MNLSHIRRLAATVPATIDARQRARLNGYADTASRCEARIQRLRAELERSIESAVETPPPVADTAEPNESLLLARELDALERLQPRVDGWFTDYVAALVAAQSVETYGDGAPM